MGACQIAPHACHLYPEGAHRHAERRPASALGQHGQHQRLNHLVSWALGVFPSAGTHLQQAHSQRGQQTQQAHQTVNGLQLPLLNATPAFKALMIVLNGTITNDKFCMSRMGRLHLTWWRLPLRARIPVTNQIEYPTDVNEMKCCHQEGTHEETEVQHPASHERDCRCATTGGSSLPVSYPMEQRVPEGGSSRAYSTGEQP